MILLILFISIVLLVTGIYLQDEYGSWLEVLGLIITIAGGVGALIAGIASIFITIEVVGHSTIDEKIAMYQEENAKIEEQIATVVKQYQDYETEIFTNTSNTNAMTLISLYPELKSDTLVNSQIEVYVSNNEKIKQLKESDINGDVYKWWLYFGGEK